MDMDNVEFIWSNEAMKNENYWKIVMNVATHNSLQRIIRCSQIMGRDNVEELKASQIFYPCMQCADIFYLKADVTQLGMDQRKVNVLAREVGEKLGFWKPVVVSHHMLAGLEHTSPVTAKISAYKTDAINRTIQLKMSKSNPDTAIFMTDTPQNVQRKISKAFCPEKSNLENPILEYNKYILFEKLKKVKIERPAKFGGDVEYKSYLEMENDYMNAKLHPLDLKNATAKYINEILEPTHKHFEKNAKARALLEKVKSFEITR